MTLMAEPKPLVGIEDNGPGSTLAAAREVIQSNYPHVDGQMIIRQVSKSAETTWYRVNWYKKGDYGMYIHHSRFLALRKTAEGVSVEDQTAQPRKPKHALN